MPLPTVTMPQIDLPDQEDDDEEIEEDGSKKKRSLLQLSQIECNSTIDDEVATSLQLSDMEEEEIRVNDDEEEEVEEQKQQIEEEVQQLVIDQPVESSLPQSA